MPTKSSLGIQLSRLNSFSKPVLRLEQYPTDPEIAASLLWDATMQGDIEGKSIADLGCGTGILGIGALILGAGDVSFFDVDEEALDVAKENLKIVGLQGSLNKLDISDVSGSFDTVIMNPPFGAQARHADRRFLEKAIELAPIIKACYLSLPL